MASTPGTSSTFGRCAGTCIATCTSEQQSPKPWITVLGTASRPGLQGSTANYICLFLNIRNTASPCLLQYKSNSLAAHAVGFGDQPEALRKNNKIECSGPKRGHKDKKVLGAVTGRLDRQGAWAYRGCCPSFKVISAHGSLVSVLTWGPVGLKPSFFHLKLAR